MFKTSPLKSFKGVYSSLHQPLPLNKRESQQLLNTITASFRKQLDSEHGWAPEDMSLSPGPGIKLSYLPQTQPGSGKAPPTTHSKDAFRRPTDRHVRAILSNPLFTPSAQTERKPVDVFDEAVARGLMTIRRAHGFLLSVRRVLTESASGTLVGAMAESNAGRRVVQWIQSADPEHELEFLKNSAFTALLLQFMVAEGLDDVAWIWLERIVKGEGPQMIGTMSTASVLLDRFVAAKSTTVALDAAYQTFLRGEDIMLQRSAPLLNLSLAWSNLAWKTTIDSWKHTSPSEALYDSFLQVPKQMGQAPGVDAVHLTLLHPSRPDSTPAVRFLSEKGTWGTLAATTPTTESSSHKNNASRLTTKVTSLGLHTAQYLTHSGKQDEAQRILDILKTHLGSYFTHTPVLGRYAISGT
jgi:hypothetical protein